VKKERLFAQRVSLRILDINKDADAYKGKKKKKKKKKSKMETRKREREKDNVKLMLRDDIHLVRI
jgi:hypothetical protein